MPGFAASPPGEAWSPARDQQGRRGREAQGLPSGSALLALLRGNPQPHQEAVSGHRQAGSHLPCQVLRQDRAEGGCGPWSWPSDSTRHRTPPTPSPVVCPAVAGAVWPCPWLCHSPVACTSLRSSAQGPGAVLRSLAGLGAGRWDRLPWRGEPLLPSLAEAGPSLRRPCPHVKPHGALEPQATGEKCQASQFIILVYMPSLFFQLNAVTAVDWP